MIDLATVYKIASLARLELSTERAEQMARELSKILTHVDAIRNAPVDTAPDSDYVENDLAVSMRGDDVQPSLPIDEVLKLAPDSAGRHYRVARVLGE